LSKVWNGSLGAARVASSLGPNPPARQATLTVAVKIHGPPFPIQSSRTSTRTTMRGNHLNRDIDDHHDQQHRHHDDRTADQQHQAEVDRHLASRIAAKGIAVTGSRRPRGHDLRGVDGQLAALGGLRLPVDPDGLASGLPVRCGRQPRRGTKPPTRVA